MQRSLFGIERSTITASLTMIACWGCSGSSNSNDASGGGSQSLGGAPSGGVVSTSSTSSGLASGGAAMASGGAGLGGAPETGGAEATGGKTSAGTKATGGQVATGGVGTGGANPTGGSKATGGKSATGVNTGGTKAATGGSRATGGAETGTQAATGGTKSTSSGGSPSSGGNAAGGTGVGGITGTGGGSSASCPATVMKSGDSTQTVKVGSLSRTYILHIPTGYTGSKALPLVVDFHPLGGTGSSQKSLSGWDKKGDANMFITAFPDSAANASNAWNVGMCCQTAQQNQIDDVGFVKAMIQQIEGLACVDTKRIYASGCSNGGGMTYKAACDLADVFAAGAPVDFRCVYGGTTASPSCAGCQPKRPISIIHFDNTGDTSLVPYNGGMTSFAADCPPNQSCTGMGFPSAADNFKTWEGLDQCTGSVAPKAGSCVTNSDCQGGTQMTICVQSGGSHCGNYGSLKIVDTAWTEFQKLSLP